MQIIRYPDFVGPAGSQDEGKCCSIAAISGMAYLEVALIYIRLRVVADVCICCVYAYSIVLKPYRLCACWRVFFDL